MTANEAAAPSVWAVTLGYNHVEDTIACLHSVAHANLPGLHLLFVDNASSDGSIERVRTEFPDTHVLDTGANLGFARGFNTGLAYALRQGGDYVFMLNNDTLVDDRTLPRLLEAARACPDAGLLVPKIFHFDEPDVVWSAGSRYRRFPPAIIMRRTSGPDDGRYDAQPDLEFATTCALLFPRRFLEQAGLLNANYFILYDDYDLCLRARDAGFRIRLVPEAHLWHKVSRSTGVGTPSPFFWTHYGRSEMIFCRTHRKHRWMTGPVHRLYVIARFLAEGHRHGLRPFLNGLAEGRRAELKPIPHWDDGSVDPVRIVHGVELRR